MRAIWSIGFRPFFLGGAVSSVFLVLFWAIAYFQEELPTGYFDPINWHAHEMIFGFATSIVAGFLLTASSNWTQTAPVSGRKLQALFWTWFAGRLVMALSLSSLPVPYWIYALIDLAFLPLLAMALAPHLLAARQLKNIQFLFVLSILWMANLMTHLAAFDIVSFSFATKGIYLGLNLIVIIMIIIGGRVVPFFTANAVPGVKIRKFPWVEKAAVISAWAFVAADFYELETLPGVLALVAGIFNGIRLIGWDSLKTKKVPLLWILHVAYAWIIVGFFLVFLSDVLDLIPRSGAIHAFTAGAMGTFIIGMISRVSLGHSGRPLKLAHGFVMTFYLICLSGIIRVVSVFLPDLYKEGIILAGICWAMSFMFYVIYYAKILTSPRADGRAG